MTLICAMKFNSKHGAMIADERLTSGKKKYDIDKKIYELPRCKGIVGLIAGSGQADPVYLAIQDACDAIIEKRQDVKTGKQLAEVVSGAISYLKRQLVDDHFLSKYGLREADFQSGKIPAEKKPFKLDESFAEKYEEELDSKELKDKLENDFLTVVCDSEFRMFRTDMGKIHPSLVELPYDCIGSGSKYADAALSDFVKSVPREKRSNIDSLDGMAALLCSAEYAARRITAVGGTPLINIIKSGKIITPSEVNSRLAMDVIKAGRHGFVSLAFQREALDDLLYKNADFMAVDKRMQSAAGRRYEKLRWLLRGYSV